MLVCNGQGQIPVQEIIDEVNLHGTNIGTNAGVIVILENSIISNASAIALLDIRVSALEAVVPPTQIEVDAIEGRVTVNEGLIAGHTITINASSSSILLLESQMALLEPRVTANELAISTAENDIVLVETDVSTLVAANVISDGRITQNETDIGTNQTDILALQTAVGLTGEAMYVHETATAVDGGASTAATWTARNIATEKLNGISATGGATSVTLPAGDYEFEVYATVVGSAHQTRINIGGTSFIYGLSCNSEGISKAIGRATLAVSSVVSIETNVDVGVAASGFGLSNTYGTENTYVIFNIKKVG